MLKEALKRGADRTGISWLFGKLSSGGKWFADHTGISWLLGKFSSGWKWLFSSKTDAYAPLHSEEEEKSAEQQTKPSQTPVHGVDNFLKVEGNRLYLNLTEEMLEKCKDCKNSEGTILLLIEHEGNEFYVTGTLDEKKHRIVIEDIHDIYHGVNKVKISDIPIGNQVDGVEFVPVIRALSILEKNAHGQYVNRGTILNMVAAAANDTGVVVKVSSDQSVARAATSEQQPKVKPAQPNSAPVVDQTTTPKQPNAQEPQAQHHSGCLSIESTIETTKDGDKKEVRHLVLSMTDEVYKIYKKCTHPDDASKVVVYVKCDHFECRIVGSFDEELSAIGKCSVIKVSAISKKNSVGRYKNSNTILVAGDIDHVKKILGWSNHIKMDAVMVSSEPFVAQPKQQPAQPNNEPVVNQTTTPKQLNAQDPQTHTVMLDVGYFIGEGDNLVLNMTSERYQELKGSTYLYIKNDKAEHRVTVSGNYSYHEDSGRYDVHITSIVEIKGGVLYESENIVEDVKKLLKPGVVAFVESISTKYSGKSLHVVQCPPLVTGYVRVDDDKLIFVIEDISPERYEGYINSKNTKEHLFFIQCGGKEYRITGVLDGNVVSINSIVEMENGMEKGEIFCPADHMEIIKTKLGLLDEKLNCTVTHHTASKMQQDVKPVVADTMTASSASVYSDAQSTPGSTDAEIKKEGMVNGVASDQSIGDSDSEYDSDTTITNASLSTMIKPSANKGFFHVYSSVIAKKELKKSDSMTASSASFFSATSGASDDSETLSFTDARSTRDSDSDTTITNDSLSTTMKPSAGKDFFGAYSSVNHCKVIATIPEAPYGPAEMQKPLKQQVEAMKNGEAELHVSPELSKALHYLHKESLEGDKLLHKTVQNSLSKTGGEKPDSLFTPTVVDGKCKSLV